APRTTAKLGRGGARSPVSAPAQAARELPTSFRPHDADHIEVEAVIEVAGRRKRDFAKIVVAIAAPTSRAEHAPSIVIQRASVGRIIYMAPLRTDASGGPQRKPVSAHTQDASASKTVAMRRAAPLSGAIFSRAARRACDPSSRFREIPVTLFKAPSCARYGAASRLRCNFSAERVSMMVKCPFKKTDINAIVAVAVLSIAPIVPSGAADLIEPPVFASKNGLLDLVMIAKPQSIASLNFRTADGRNIHPAGWIYEICRRSPSSENCPAEAAA